MIPYARQSISQRDVDAVIEVLQSDFITQGPHIETFEQAVSDKVQSRFAVALNSATSALHSACAALGLSETDCLWTTPNSFVASANCARYCGAKVDFVDIDPRSYLLCPNQLEDKLKRHAPPKILVVVHFAGQPCDMQAIHQLSQRYDFRVIEDASHAIGAFYQDEPVGHGRYSDISVFSFHPVKIITTGEGGMAVTNDAGLADHMRHFRTHGIRREASKMHRTDQGPWYYEQHELGYNYRMNDLQAALGLSQLQRLEAFITRRRALAARYDQLLKDVAISRPHQMSYGRSAFHLYVVRLQDAQKRHTVFTRLRDNGIGVNVHYIPIHLQPYYQALGFREGDFPEAEAYYQSALSLPMFPALSDEQQDEVVRELKAAL